MNLQQGKDYVSLEQLAEQTAGALKLAALFGFTGDDMNQKAGIAVKKLTGVNPLEMFTERRYGLVDVPKEVVVEEVVPPFVEKAVPDAFISRFTNLTKDILFDDLPGLKSCFDDERISNVAIERFVKQMNSLASHDVITFERLALLANGKANVGLRKRETLEALIDIGILESAYNAKGFLRPLGNTGAWDYVVGNSYHLGFYRPLVDLVAFLKPCVPEEIVDEWLTPTKLLSRVDYELKKIGKSSRALSGLYLLIKLGFLEEVKNNRYCGSTRIFVALEAADGFCRIEKDYIFVNRAGFDGREFAGISTCVSSDKVPDGHTYKWHSSIVPVLVDLIKNNH